MSGEHQRFSIDPGTLLHRMDAGTYARGREVYLAQKVLSSELYGANRHEWHLNGEVQGSRGEVYEVGVELEVDAAGRITRFDGDCDCPVGHNCKHAVALTLRAAFRSGAVRAATAAPAQPAAPTVSPQERERQRAGRELAQWLDLFGSANDTAADATPSDDNALRPVFMLHPQRLASGGVHGARQLALGWGLSRQGRGGRWLKVRPPRYDSEDGASAEARQAIGLIRALRTGEARHSAFYHGYGGTPAQRGLLAGDAGLLAVQHAARDGHLFLCEQDDVLGPPLAWGAPRTVTWQWQQQHDPRLDEPVWRIAAHLPEGGQCFANQPPLYLDASQGVTGPLQVEGLAPEHLSLLLKAPPMPQSALAEHEATLLRHLAGLPLPPVITAPQDVQGITPVARLAIAPVPAAQVPHRGLLVAALRFDYGDGVRHYTRLPQNPVLIDLPPEGKAGQTVAAGKTGKPDAPAAHAVRRVRLHRDMAAEQAAHRALHALGLSGDVHGAFHLPVAPEHAAESQQPWLRWADGDFAELRAAGLHVDASALPPGWIARADALQVDLAPEAPPGAAPPDTPGDAGNAPAGDDSAPWFNLSLGMSLGGERYDILPLLPALLAHLPEGAHKLEAGDLPAHVYLPRPDGEGYLRLPTAPLVPWLAALIELLDSVGRGKENLRLSRAEVLRLTASLGEGAVWQGAAQLGAMMAQLRGQATLPAVAPPAGLRAELRPYQLHGLSWLQFLRAHQLGGVLADDMGLGKTLQTLAHLLTEKEAGRLTHPALVVAPVSLMGNWQREAARFAPDLRTLVWHGADRHALIDRLDKVDVVITPYSLLHRDRDLWLARPWHVVVLDEAQHIKNAATHAAQVASELHATQRLALSGTPMENHLGELWSLFHFLMPGFLGSARQFTQWFRTPIEKHGDEDQMAALRQRVTPFMLRRAKAQVATDLPPKQEFATPITLGPQQANLYETIRLATERTVRDALAGKGLARSQIEVLDALLKLRQVCCDPRLVPTAAARKVKSSAKLDWLLDTLPELIAEGRRVLLFSQFTSMLALIEQELPRLSLPWTKLTGQTQKRDAAIARFTGGEVPLFLISLKAGGTGLNLVQADTVIHYDPWWNPAAEHQATDRAHRIGQTQPVMVYKLVAEGTIEERILALQARKAALAEGIYSAAAGRKQPLFTEGDLAELLRPLGS
ncbi:MAG: DEAD/DEAH box helicase [Pseudomonadota bacterium]|nr:DEAD/DEAH box helicase [Pseudomonadota bacterium]